MKKFILIILVLLLSASFIFADRKSYDAVPATNSAFNNYVQDVIGNKLDTTNGNSIMSRIQTIQNNSTNNSGTLAAITNMQNNIDTIELTVTNTLSDVTNLQNSVDVVDGYMDVPTTNSTASNQMRDIIGNKLDTHTGNSVMSRLESMDDYLHGMQRVYPTLGAGTNVVTDSTVWTLSNGFTNITVPSNVITSDFSIHHLSIEQISANGVYELVLYNMTAKTEIGRVRFTKNAAQDGIMDVPFSTAYQAANSQIGARVASDSGADNVTFAIIYHTE